MPCASASLSAKSRLAVLLERFATTDDPLDVRPISRPLAEILLLMFCGTIADCDDYGHIAAWGEAGQDFLGLQVPDENDVPAGRWLTIPVCRINPSLFCAVFTAWVLPEMLSQGHHQASSRSVADGRVKVLVPE